MVLVDTTITNIQVEIQSLLDDYKQHEEINIGCRWEYIKGIIHGLELALGVVTRHKLESHS